MELCTALRPTLKPLGVVSTAVGEIKKATTGGFKKVDEQYITFRTITIKVPESLKLLLQLVIDQLRPTAGSLGNLHKKIDDVCASLSNLESTIVASAEILAIQQLLQQIKDYFKTSAECQIITHTKIDKVT